MWSAYVYSISACSYAVKTLISFAPQALIAIFYCFHLSFPIIQLSGKCYIFPCVEHRLKSLESRVLENQKMSTGYEDFKEIAPTLSTQ